MNIKVNGKESVIDVQLTIEELLKQQKVQMLEYVSVQLNDEIVDREDFSKITVKENDEIEFLYFMGGGSK